MSLERFARSGSCKISWKWTKGSTEGGHRKRRRRVGRCQAGEGGQHLPTVLAGNNLLHALNTWLGGSPGPSCHILLCHRVPAPGMDAKGAGSVTAGHMTPLCCKVTVCWSCGHHCALQAKDHYFFPAEEWKYFWQSSNFKWFLLNAAPCWQFPPRDQHKQGGHRHSTA